MVRYLVNLGIAQARLESQGYGDTRPIADNKTAKGKAQNRRVDFRITNPATPAAASQPSAPPAAKPAGQPKNPPAPGAGRGKSDHAQPASGKRAPAGK